MKIKYRREMSTRADRSTFHCAAAPRDAWLVSSQVETRIGDRYKLSAVHNNFSPVAVQLYFHSL